MVTIKRFFAYSIVLHITIFIAALLIISPVKDKKGEEFFARLVSPEEFLPPAAPIPAIPQVRPSPPVRPRTTQPKTSMPAPEIKKGTQTVPGSGITSPQPLSQPASPPSQGVEGKSGIGSQEIKGATQEPGVPMPSTREKLFDRNIIGDMAKRDIKKEEKEERSFSFDVKEMRYLAYLRRLKERIESIWIYPPNAAEKGIYGDLIIKFTIKKNGKLGAVELVRTSGFRDLDDAALRALKDAEPFWPLPDEWGMEAYTIEGHFVYTIYGYYVR
ncbi:MAG: TonB family protein [Nitrospirota bacterium]|jgi:protein TonB